MGEYGYRSCVRADMGKWYPVPCLFASIFSWSSDGSFRLAFILPKALAHFWLRHDTVILRSTLERVDADVAGPPIAGHLQDRTSDLAGADGWCDRRRACDRRCKCRR